MKIDTEDFYTYLDSHAGASDYLIRAQMDAYVCKTILHQVKSLLRREARLTSWDVEGVRKLIEENEIHLDMGMKVL